MKKDIKLTIADARWDYFAGAIAELDNWAVDAEDAEVINNVIEAMKAAKDFYIKRYKELAGE